MTEATARAAAATLKEALQDYGVPTSIELMQGVGPAGDRWGPAPFVRTLWHHVASYPPGTPGLAVVKFGRGGTAPLQGPLANCYGGFDRVARILTMGWANHPGLGGPWSVPGWGTVPKDNGRPYLLGWEFEGGYLPYTDEMIEFMSRCGAASLDWLGTHNGREPAPLECGDEHKGWAGPRKSDRIGYTTSLGRQRVAAVRGTTIRPTPPETTLEDDVPTLILEPGQSGTLPTPYGDNDLWVTCDNAEQVKDGDAVAESARVRLAVQTALPPAIQWKPAGGSFQPTSDDPYAAVVPLGGTGVPIGAAYCVSAINQSKLRLTVTVAPHVG